MKLSSWILLIISAILYPIPLIFPLYAWWIAFLFPLPLFYIATQENLGFLHGFIWGIASISTHLVGVLIGIDGFTSSDGGIARSLPGLILIGYGGLCSGTWFWLTTRIKKILKLSSSYAIIALWVITLWCFIFFLDRLVLAPFDRVEGYFAFHPILALAIHPQLLRLMPILGKNILSLLMYLVPATIALWVIKRNTLNALLFLAALAPWAISLMLPIPEAQRPAWVNTIAVLPAVFPEMQQSITQGEVAQKYFLAMIKQNPAIQIIILPESSFYCYNLEGSPDLCHLWSEVHLEKPKHVILGAFRWDGPHFRNSLHWIYNGKIEGIFDKRHAVALTERIPSLINIGIVQGLFFQNFPPIKASLVERPIFKLSDAIELTPYICSELFFNEHPDDNHLATPILATTNDRWCQGTYVTELMYLDARLKAIQWQRDVIYVSFKYAAYLDKWGNESPLIRTT